MPVDRDFSASLLRTSRAFHDHLQPRLWAHVDVTCGNPRRHPTLFIDCLTRANEGHVVPDSGREIPSHRLMPLIRSLAFDIDDLSRERLDTERLALLVGKGAAASVTELTINIVGEVDDDDIALDADGVLELVRGCLQLRRLVLCGHVSEDFFRRLHVDLADRCLDAETRLASLELELPPEALLERAARVENGPALPCFGTLRTAFVAPRRRKYARQLSSGMLGYILRTIERDRTYQKTLVLGPALIAYLDGPLCTSDDRKELALAQMVAKKGNAAGNCQVIFPPGLDLSVELERDWAYQDAGVDGVVAQWFVDEWPLDPYGSEGSDDGS